MGFSFKALWECDRCGEPLESSDSDCPSCTGVSDQEMVFRNISTDEIRSIRVAITADTSFMWEKFSRSLDREDPIPYAWLGNRSTVDALVDSPSFDSVSDIRQRQMSMDYYGDEDLRELASFEPDG